MRLRNLQRKKAKASEGGTPWAFSVEMSWRTCTTSRIAAFEVKISSTTCSTGYRLSYDAFVDEVFDGVDDGDLAGVFHGGDVAVLAMSGVMIVMILLGLCC